MERKFEFYVKNWSIMVLVTIWISLEILVIKYFLFWPFWDQKWCFSPPRGLWPVDLRLPNDFSLNFSPRRTFFRFFLTDRATHLVLFGGWRRFDKNTGYYRGGTSTLEYLNRPKERKWTKFAWTANLHPAITFLALFGFVQWRASYYSSFRVDYFDTNCSKIWMNSCCVRKA